MKGIKQEIQLFNKVEPNVKLKVKMDILGKSLLIHIVLLN